MNQHEHGHKHDHHHEHGHQHSKNQGLHKDWRMWAIVILMLAAMFAYVASMDESIVPGDPAEPRMPAAAE